MDVPLCGDLIVQLTHRTAAEISGVFVPGVHVGDLLVDPLKIRILDYRLSPEHQLAGVGDV